ncbi:unnamed protein product [Adineta ricciae]|uniref:Uncharacterized protein n=1 Tax=Adineta ricciae TaxID=249248 RepID=A0A814WV53_ADIRI|nr:unnamed protein product [Adineta ricciae]
MEKMTLEELFEKVSMKLREPISNVQSLFEWKTQMLTYINTIADLKCPISSSTVQKNSSLDPSDWPSARKTAHEVLDSSLDYIESIRDRPAFIPIPDDVWTVLNDDPLPKRGQSLEQVCRDTFTYVVPYTFGNAHPRFLGWVGGEGTLGGALADMIAATINMSCGGFCHSGSLIERTVINWIRQMFGFPEAKNAGLIVSGTSMATLISIATARRKALGNIRQDGHVNGPQLVGYASTETHACLVKAFELLGLGSKALHLIAVDDDFRMKIDELKVAMQEDREKGLVPFCIVGNAGTVNTAAFDNLVELSAICRAENIWFHVDGAFGSLVILDRERRHLVKGIERADSLAFDLHKWLHCPYDAGCVLIRESSHLQSTFAVHQTYLTKTIRDFEPDDLWFCDLGPELSRSFRALKVWFTFKEHGIGKLGQKIADNCEQAQYFARLLEKHADIIHVLRPITLNIVNFRVIPKELDGDDHEVIDQFNADLTQDVQMSGVAIPSTSRIGNRLHIRICVVSHRCVYEDFDSLVTSLLKLTQQRLAKMKEAKNSK